MKTLARGLAAMMAALALLSAVAAPVAAITTRNCDTVFVNNIFSGGSRYITSSVNLTTVQGEVEKQFFPLCTNSTAASASAASDWVMIAGGGSTSYIQYGFINCNRTCVSPPGATGGVVREFVEWNSGWWIPQRYFLPSSLGNGRHTLKIQHQCAPTCVFNYYRAGGLQAQTQDNGWRGWSLYGASIQLFSETWNRGDQNGGSPSDTLQLYYAKYGVGYNTTLTNAGLSNPCVKGQNSGFVSEYGCTNVVGSLAYDSVATWTNNR